ENRAPDGHPVVRRVRLTQPEVAPDPAIPRMPVLDQPGRAARAGPVLILISEARFIGVDVNRRTRYSCHRCEFGMIRGHGAARRNRCRRSPARLFPPRNIQAGVSPSLLDTGLAPRKIAACNPPSSLDL